jgi:hypothetical protein
LGLFGRHASADSKGDLVGHEVEETPERMSVEFIISQSEKCEENIATEDFGAR